MGIITSLQSQKLGLSYKGVLDPIYRMEGRVDEDGGQWISGVVVTGREGNGEKENRERWTHKVDAHVSDYKREGGSS